MGRKFFSVSKKLEISNQAETSGNIAATARAHNVHHNQIRYWKRGKENLIEKSKIISKPAQCTLEIKHITRNWKVNCTIGLQISGNMALLYLLLVSSAKHYKLMLILKIVVKKATLVALQFSTPPSLGFSTP